MTRKEKSTLAILIVLIAVIAIFFGTRKIDYHVDEVWTFGLANHIGGIEPDIEYGKTYSGMGFFKDFMEVDSNHRFDYVNLWQNQANDVHPPLYYIFVHTICSLFPDSYSMWYGLCVNLMWMIFIMILFYKLARLLTGSAAQAFGAVLVYGTTVAFIDTLLFIRMYTQFTFFAIAISYLLAIYWDKELDKKFYALFSLIVVFGMLSHYYFLIFTFFVCATFALHLIFEKRFIELRNSIIVAACDGIVYLLIWPYMIKHILHSGRGQQAIHSAFSISGLIKGIVGVFREIDIELFAGAMILFIVLVLILAVKKIKSGEMKYSFKAALLLSAVLYTCAVGKIAPYIEFRYVMPVTFVFALTALLVLTELLGGLKIKKNAGSIAIIILLVLNLINFSSKGFYVPKDYYSSEKIENFRELADQDIELCIEENWEALDHFQQLLHAKSYVITKASKND